MLMPVKLARENMETRSYIPDVSFKRKKMRVMKRLVLITARSRKRADLMTNLATPKKSLVAFITKLR